MSHPSSNSTYPSLLQRPATPQTYIEQYAQDQARIWDASGHRMHHLVPASHQITRHSSLAPNIHRWEYLPLNSYGGGRGQGTGGVVEFVRGSGQVLLLTDALHETCPDLRDAERSAPLGDVSSKLSIRIPFPGAEPYTRQITARRSTVKGESVFMKVLARKIAEEMEKYIVRTFDHFNRHDFDMLPFGPFHTQVREQRAQTPLMYRNMPVRVDQLALRGVQNISDGSWVPIFMIYTLPDPRGPAAMVAI